MNLVIILTFLFHISAIKADYFWRDYYGNVPSDAVPGGRNVDGSDLYIGQAFNVATQNILIGYIFKNDPYVYGHNLDKGKSITLVKILCSHDSSDLRWIKTNITDLRLLTECNQIVAGFYKGALTTVGRANYQGGTYVGNIYDYAPNKWHFFLTQINGYELNSNSFEVLVHGCKNQNQTCITSRR